MTELRYKEKTGILRGLIFQVRNELGGGWSEDVFHQALYAVLQDNNISVVSKPRRPFLYHGVEVHIFEPDLIVWDLIILELKALPYQKGFTGAQFAQIIHYLKFWQKGLGLLVNFGRPRVEIKRVIWDEPAFDIYEKYDEIHSCLSEADRVILREVRKHILTVASQVGLGYPETLYRKLVAIESEIHNLPCVVDVGITPTWRDGLLPRHVTPHLYFANKFLVHIRSLLEHPTRYDFIATRTYLRNMGLDYGLVVNFGQKKLQIYGVKSD
jgi:GxxExxY protein